jgi:DNA-binding response OmpR family regulator
MPANTTILIADDDKDLISTLCEYLTTERFIVTTAANGEEAISHLRQKKFDVAVLDLKMPKVDGFEVLKFIKTGCSDTKVIILTGYADLKNIVECKKLGADDVIEKPYDIGELLGAIEYVLKK